MKKRSFFFSLITLAMVLAILACNLPGSGAPTPTSQVVVVTATTEPETSQPESTQAETTLTLTDVSASITPTITNLPPTETLTPTATLPPCNRASFVQDVSVPDGTVFVTGAAFTKTWRLKNTGSCTWTSGYQLIFFNGDQMNGPGAQSLTSGTVAPGGTVDVSVNLVAPASAGTYHGNWKIREPGGATFGLSTGPFWVEIKTEEPTVVPPASLPDLYVSEFTITPATPIKGQPAHIRIGVYNGGNAVASQFTVLWYGLSTFSNPSCSWDILNNVNPHGGRILECDFVFQSPYPINKTSLVIVDSTNHVVESDEDNNEGTISPFGVVNP